MSDYKDLCIEILSDENHDLRLRLLAADQETEVLVEMVAEATAELRVRTEMLSRALAMLNVGVEPGFPEGLGKLAISEATKRVQPPSDAAPGTRTTTPAENEIEWDLQ